MYKIQGNKIIDCQGLFSFKVQSLLSWSLFLINYNPDKRLVWKSKSKYYLFLLMMCKIKIMNTWIIRGKIKLNHSHIKIQLSCVQTVGYFTTIAELKARGHFWSLSQKQILVLFLGRKRVLLVFFANIHFIILLFIVVAF